MSFKMVFSNARSIESTFKVLLKINSNHVLHNTMHACTYACLEWRLQTDSYRCALLCRCRHVAMARRAHGCARLAPVSVSEGVSGQRCCFCLVCCFNQIPPSSTLQIPVNSEGDCSTTCVDGCRKQASGWEIETILRNRGKIISAKDYFCFIVFFFSPLRKGFIFYYIFESLSHISQYFEGCQHTF